MCDRTFPAATTSRPIFASVAGILSESSQTPAFERLRLRATGTEAESMNASRDIAVLTSSRSQTLGSRVEFLRARLGVEARHAGRMTREVTWCLRLRPRGGVAHDVLHLAALSLRLRVEWRARDIHPWDHDLSEHRQAQLFARQCLEDVDAAIARMFDRVPEMQVLEVVVRAPRSGAIIMSGVVHRDDLRGTSHLTLEMKLRTIGMKYQLFDCRFESLPSPEGLPRAAGGL
jgi:hypothetical protein